MANEQQFHHIIDEDLELCLLDEDDAQRYIRSSLGQFVENNGFQAGMWYRGTLAGIIGYQGVDWVNRSTALGYWVGASCQGKGLVTKACSALIDPAFREWRLNRVEIRCATGNDRSQAITERLGFTQEGTLRGAEWLYDHFADLAVYSVLAGEWRERGKEPLTPDQAVGAHSRAPLQADRRSEVWETPQAANPEAAHRAAAT